MKDYKVFYILKILFAIIIIIGIYAIYYFTRLTSKKVLTSYEVTFGKILNVDRHTGLIYRDEELFKCENDGFINFYVSSGKKVYNGEFVYTINEKEQKGLEIDLNEENLKVINQSIKSRIDQITDANFLSAYSLKPSIERQIDEIALFNKLKENDLSFILSSSEVGFSKCSGIVSFYIDYFHNADYKSFDENLIKNYSYTPIKAKKNIVKKGDGVYVLIKDTEYAIVFDSDYDYSKYIDKTYTINFPYENVMVKSKINSFIGTDGNTHFMIVLNDYIDEFIDKRIVDFEILNKDVSGLKIPIKSIISGKDAVYIVNKGYAEEKTVEIIDKSNEYAIINKDTSSGLKQYDHIALDASTVAEGDLIWYNK